MSLVDQAINVRGPLAATSGAPRAALASELERALEVGGQLALDAAADAASRARAVLIFGSAVSGGGANTHSMRIAP